MRTQAQAPAQHRSTPSGGERRILGDLNMADPATDTPPPALPGALTVEFPLTTAYETDHVTVVATSATLTLPLSPGAHGAESPAVTIGTLKDFGSPEITAAIQLVYQFDPAVPELTLTAPDLAAAEAPRVRTQLRDLPQAHALLSARTDGDLASARWHPGSPLTPGLDDMLRLALFTAVDRIQQAALAQGINVLLRDRFPQLDADTYARLCMVFEGGAFQELYQPGKRYGPDAEFFHIESTYGGLYIFATNAAFANVIGSTYDPKVAGQTWIALWRAKTGLAGTTCSSRGYPTGFSCNTPILGGHVVSGTVAKSVPTGGSCYIIPICNHHNTVNSSSMEAITNQKAVVLKDYMRTGFQNLLHLFPV